MKNGRTIIVLGLLAFTAGALDGSLFSLYDKAFASIMTGNMILLGVAAASGSVQQLVVLSAALAGYVSGVFVGARTVKGYSELFHANRWPSRIIICLSTTCGLLVCALAFTLVSSGDSRLLPLLFFSLATAMGIMAAAVRRIGHSVSATYLTGAITQFWERIATRSPLAETGKASLMSVGSLVLGAVSGGVLSDHIQEWSLVVPISSTLTAIIVLVIGNALQRPDVSAQK